MQIMDYINAHRMDENPCECVILPDGSVEEPTPSHIEKLAQIAGEDKISINKKMDKNMEPLLFMVEYTGCRHGWLCPPVLPPNRRRRWKHCTLQQCFRRITCGNRWGRIMWNV